MHKVKKNWVTIGVTALSMVTVANGTLLADQQVQADEQNPANQSGDSSQDLLQETPATTNDAATTVAPTISADANTASVAIPVADATSTTTAATDGAAAPAANTATVDTNSGQAAPSTNVQAAAADTSATPTDTNNATATATTDRAATTDTANTEARTRSRRAWQKLEKPTPTQRLVSNGSTVNNTMSIVTVVCVRTSSLSKTVSLITLMLKQGLLRPSHRMNFQQNLSRRLWIFHLETSSTKRWQIFGPTGHLHHSGCLVPPKEHSPRMVRLGQLQPKLTNVHSWWFGGLTNQLRLTILTTCKIKVLVRDHFQQTLVRKV